MQRQIKTPKTNSPHPLNFIPSSSSPPMVEPLAAAPSFSDDLLDLSGLEVPVPLPAAVEEELEWLSVFPTVEECFETDYLSPVSVLAAAAAPGWPVRPRSKGRRRGRKVLPVFRRPARRRCRHCEAEETPQWRAGPDGPKTLCNACGVRFKSGRLVPEYRPASSPTFAAGTHSNSHRRIVEMRRRMGGDDGGGGAAV